MNTNKEIFYPEVDTRVKLEIPVPGTAAKISTKVNPALAESKLAEIFEIIETLQNPKEEKC